ncbi:MAG: hypothetical protein PWQ20_1420 [Thermotogaceae bacterium]|nr:hypothetical protein [Thermotogaceae bacterium]
MERIRFFFEMGFYIWPYLLVIFIYLLIFAFPKFFRKYLWYLVLSVIIFFGGFKDIMSPDFVRYEAMYRNYKALSFTSIEPFFIFLSSLLNSVHANFYAMSFINFLLTVLFVILGAKLLSKDYLYSFFIYLTIPGFFLNTFVEMRQTLGVAIFFFAIGLFLTGKKRVSWIFFIFASFVHYSAIFATALFFIVYRLLRKKYPMCYYLGFLTIGVLIGQLEITKYILTLFLPVFPRKYWAYIFASETVDPLKVTIYMLFCALLIFVFCYSTKKTDYYRNITITQLNLLILGSFIIFSSHNPVITRLAYYFLIFQLSVVPNILKSIRDPHERLLWLYLFTIYFLTQYVYGLFFIPIETGEFVFIPYRNILFK